METELERQIREARTALDGLSDTSSKSDIEGVIDTHLAVGGKLSKADKAKLLAEFKTRAGDDAALGLKMFNFLFNCTVTSKDSDELPKPFPGAGLLQVAESIAAFPPDVYPKKWDFTQLEGTTFTGGFWGSGESVVANVGMEDVTGRVDHEAFSQDYLNANVEEQALYGTKNFDNIVKHEIGHGVDEKVNAKTLTLTTNGGGWIEYGSLEECLKTLTALVDEFRIAVDAAIRAHDEVPEDSDWTPKSTSEWIAIFNSSGNEIPNGGAAIAKKLAGSVAGNLAKPTNFGKKKQIIEAAIPQGGTLMKLLIQGGKNQAWATWGDPIAHGGRVYQNSAGMSGWTSFDKSTYANKVSLYQYYSPGEWFADFYTALNHDTESVRSKAIAAYTNAAKWCKTKGIALYPDEIN